MNANERMAAAIDLKPVDRVPNAPFYEAPVCRYFGKSFRAALLEDFSMTEVHLQGVEAFQFDWVMVGMGLIGGIIPEAMGCRVNWPEDVFPVIEKTAVFDNLNPNGALLIDTAEATAVETRAHLEKSRGMTGYLFSTSGTMSPNTPQKNFEAMNREVLGFR